MTKQTDSAVAPDIFQQLAMAGAVLLQLTLQTARREREVSGEFWNAQACGQSLLHHMFDSLQQASGLCAQAMQAV